MALKLDVKRFKKIASDKHSTTLQHPDGHTIKIAHKPLSLERMKELEALPLTKMASGGNVSSVQAPATPQVTAQPVSTVGKILTGAGKGLSGDENNNPLYSGMQSLVVGIGHQLNSSAPQGANITMPNGSVAGPSNNYGAPALTLDSSAPAVSPSSTLTMPTMGSSFNAPSPGVDLLPKAHGGEIKRQSYADGSEDIEPNSASDDSNSQMATMPGSTPNAQAPQQQPPASPSVPSNIPAQQQSQGANLPTGAVDQEDFNNVPGYKEQVSGIRRQANAESDLAQAQADILRKQAVDKDIINSNFQQDRENLDVNNRQFVSDVVNDHINPNQYLGDMSTAGKISVGIGLILGGIGSGLTHGPNPALQMLNANIDRDIAAQQANLGKKETLLSANLKQYGNLRDAMDATRINMNDAAATHLQAQAMKYQDPTIQARAQQAIGTLKQQNAPLAYQIATRQSVGKSIQAGVDPAILVESVITDPEQRKAALAEVKTNQELKGIYSSVLSNFDQAVQDTKGLGRVGSLVKTPRSVMAYHQTLQPLFKDIDGRVNNSIMEDTFKNTTPSPFDTEADTAQKRKALMQYVSSKMQSPVTKAASYGAIDLSKFPSTSLDPVLGMNPQQKNIVDWARANPNNPRAQMALKKLGVQ